MGNKNKQGKGKEKPKPPMVQIKPRNEAQAEFMELLREPIEQTPLILAFGPAGTGKTLLVVDDAVKRLRRGEIDKIIITRPAVSCEDLGALPGDEQQKVAPYMQPIFDSLQLLAPGEWKGWVHEGKVVVAPLAFMRGKTFNRCYLLLDEAQNITKGLLKMALTRVGEGSRCVVDGDAAQIDLPKKQESAAHLLDMFTDREDMGIVVFEFFEEDSVRSEVCKNVLKIFAANGM